MSEINAEFALGNSLGSYRGVTWYKDNGTSGTFPTTISMGSFYSLRKTAPLTYVQYILVGGGGGGASGTQDNIGGGGGGGGGGGIYMNDVNLKSGDSFYVTIGQGGAGGYYTSSIPGSIAGYDKYGNPYPADGWVQATQGGTTMISGGPGTVTATGGYPGLARWYWNGSTRVQFSQPYRGGDGGYGQYTPNGSSTVGAIYWGIGNSGGTYQTSGSSDGKRAGGGGGGTDDTNNVWTGGNGATWFDGITYGGGGGGGGDYSWGGAGGAGGGGHGGSGVDATTAGIDGLGGGGGGGISNGGYSWGPGARGGSGRVVIRYAGTVAKASGGTVYYSGGYTYHVFTSNGTFTWT